MKSVLGEELPRKNRLLFWIEEMDLRLMEIAFVVDGIARYINEASKVEPSLDDLWARFNDLTVAYENKEVKLNVLLECLEQIMDIAAEEEDEDLKLWVAERMFEYNASNEVKDMLVFRLTFLKDKLEAKPNLSPAEQEEYYSMLNKLKMVGLMGDLKTSELFN